jgi:SpoVK/Ycf46/Vps4 family AAA+-type ATPase
MLADCLAGCLAVILQVIFVDELDAMAPSRGGAAGSSAKSSSGGGAAGRLVTALLTEMDDLRGGLGGWG